jgi:hypothetical protein
MTNDLVKRLRDLEKWLNKPKGENMTISPTLFVQAADRIEFLEDALKKIAQHDTQAIAMDALRPGERIRGKQK